ncbi:cupin domain-containing protein [Bacillus marinisedimentorum]|uniref:cupin domain-containing protein n=1 Tax=Bacillus marinisedimentorum TaxID=1821260 RepID=UPI000872BFB8|nr:cupin domain-containing protein [Bacillus marinisedimentorum]
MSNGNNPYQNPYYANGAAYNGDWMARNHQPVVDAILSGLKYETSAIDLYSRLVKVAPDDKHKKDIRRALEDEKSHLRQLTDLYTALTGSQPVYRAKKIRFDTYEEGLEKAHEIILKGCEEYRSRYYVTDHPLIRDVFSRAFTDERRHAAQFGSLRSSNEARIQLQDYGANPFAVNIDEATRQNTNFRTALWTGSNMQVTLMSLNPGEDIGLEVHPEGDQFIRVEQGQGVVQMGDRPDNLDFEEMVEDDFAMMIPEGKWHNLTNTGNIPLKVYVIYAPPEHPFGTVHETKADAMAAEGRNRRYY